LAKESGEKEFGLSRDALGELKLCRVKETASKLGLSELIAERMLKKNSWLNSESLDQSSVNATCHATTETKRKSEF
jgi:hypothetical protein